MIFKFTGRSLIRVNPHRTRDNMERKSVVFLMLLVVAGFASAKPKHHVLPEVFETAKTVHVETIDERDITDISVDRQTRNAILDVQDGIQDWGRYTLSRSRYEADLIVVIYKGRVRSNPNQTRPLTIPLSSNNPANRNPAQDPADASEGSNGSSSPDGLDLEKDELKVYALGSDGKLKDLLWHNESERGLDAPNLILLKQLEHEIDRTYPHPPATSQSNP
jgi:hypothetical protein